MADTPRSQQLDTLGRKIGGRAGKGGAGGAAPGFSIRVDGEEELRRKLKLLGDNVERMAIEAMKEGAEIVKKSAQQKVVGGPGGAIGKQITVEVVGT